MKFYDKYFASNYDELITYYPRFYRDVYEMTEILKAHGRIADELEANIEQTFFNASIDYADEATITRLENFLNIYSTKGRTLEERKRFLKSFLIGFGKISASLICQMISAYTNAPVSCRFEPFDDEGNNLFYIDFQRASNETIYMSDILTLLARKLPAHIKYRPEIVYRFPIVVGRERTNYKFEYDFSGTKPDTTLCGAAISKDTVTNQKHLNVTADYIPADNSFQTGRYHDTAALAGYITRDIALKQAHENSTFLFEEANTEKKSGRHPNAAFLGKSENIAFITKAKCENNITGYDSAGTKPDTVQLAVINSGNKRAIDATTGAAATEYSVNYSPCGTIFTQE